MAIPASLTMVLLLGQLLFPFVAAICLKIISGSARTRITIGFVCHVLLLLGSTFLLFSVLTPFASNEEGAVEGIWTLTSSTSPEFLNQISFRWDRFNAGFLWLISCGSLTASLFSGTEESRSRRIVPCLLLVGGMQIFLTGGDVGSILTGGAFSSILLCLLIQDSGGQPAREEAMRFQAVQVIGLLLLAGGLASLIGISSLIQSAPRGLPGKTSGVLTLLGDSVAKTAASHEAASEFWHDSRGVPLLLIVLGPVVMSGLFPAHLWLSRALLIGSTAARIWLILWSMSLLISGVRWISLIDPQALADLQSTGFTIALAGAFYNGGLMSSEIRPGKFLAAAVGWCLSLSCLGICASMQHADHFATGWMLSLIAGAILLVLAISTFTSEKECMVPFQRAPMLISMIALTFTPTLQGAFQLWLGLASLHGWGSWGTLPTWTVLLIANLFALAGLLRMYRLLPGVPLEATSDSILKSEVIELSQFRWRHQFFVGVWSIFMIVVGFLVPIIASSRLLQ